MRKNFLIIFILFTYSIAFAQDFSKSGWHIEAKTINPNNYYGVTVANGMVGIISSASPMKMKEVVLNGTYDLYGRGRVSNIQKVFEFANLDLDVNNQRVTLGEIKNYRQYLDMQKATFTETFDVGDKASVKYAVRSLRHLPYTSMITLEIQAKKDVEISPIHMIQSPDVLREVRNYYSVIDRPHVKIPLLTSVAQSPTGKHTIAVSCSYIFDEHKMPELTHEDWDYNMHLVRIRKKLKKGETFSFSIVGSVVSTEHFDDPHNEAERLSVYAMLEGKDRLLKRHEEAWNKLWQSDIQIEGDVQAQKDIRFALYHLYSFAREGTAYSLSPMGLSGLGYNGHVFWDTELWMYPPLLVLQPDIALSLLDYRYERLDAAKKNAASHGYDGAMFPWESDDTGLEATPVWALTGPFEHHITGCVGWAFWKYYQVTQDKRWLQEKGYPVLKEVADFWVSRVEKGEDGKYHIYNVVGADEWAENIDDNAFTNAVAIKSLQYATQAAKVLEKEPDSMWQQVANNIPILTFQDGVTREHATYKGEEIKQADVNLLAYPLDVIESETQIRKDLEYYEPRMSTTGPAMGHAVLSVLYTELGNIQKAYDLYVRSYKPNEVPPFGVIAETPNGTNPYFATGAGGMLQAVLFGFGGLEITDAGVVQRKASLPKPWKGLILKGIGASEQEFKK